MNDYDQRLLKKLRRRLLVRDNEISDERVTTVTEGTLMEMGARIEIVKEDLAEAFRPLTDVLLRVVVWMARRMERSQEEEESMIELTGHALDQGWEPHKEETWKYRFATLREPVTMKHWNGHGADPEYTDVPLEAGHRVKIVMVSRFGDVGITENLDAETGYGARVPLDVLTDFGREP